MVSQWRRVVVDGFALRDEHEEPQILLRSPEHGQSVAIPIEVHSARAVIEELEYGGGIGRLPDVVAHLLDSHGFVPTRLNVLLPQYGSPKAELCYDDRQMEHRLPMRIGEGMVMAVRLGVPIYLRSDRTDLQAMTATEILRTRGMTLPRRAG